MTEYSKNDLIHEKNMRIKLSYIYIYLYINHSISSTNSNYLIYNIELYMYACIRVSRRNIFWWLDSR